MGKILYTAYAVVVITYMSYSTFTSPQSDSSNPNSNYHGSSWGSGGSSSWHK